MVVRLRVSGAAGAEVEGRKGAVQGLRSIAYVGWSVSWLEQGAGVPFFSKLIVTCEA